MASYHDELSTPAESPGGRRSLVALGALIAGLGALAVLACTSGDEGSRRPQGEKPAEGTGGLLEVGEEEENEIIEVGVGEINPDPHAFPADPLVAEGISPAETEVFADPEQFSPGVCVHEPHLSDANGVGALFPMNWLRPRFRWTGAGDETLWEIRWSASSQMNDLRAYTRNTEWLLPKETWEKIASGVVDEITVTVRGHGPSGITGMRGTFRITPALAGGSMVFWGTSSSVVESGSSRLYGFTMGDEAVADVLGAEDVNITGIVKGDGRDLRGETEGSYVPGIAAGAPQCVGCHVGTPDGLTMAFTDNYPWNMAIASIDEGQRGAIPDYVSTGGQELMKMPFLGTAAMLPKPWLEDGDRTMITTMGRRTSPVPHIYVNYGYGDPPTVEPTVHDLIWIDLQATGPTPTPMPAPEGVTAPWGDGDYSGSPRDEARQERQDAYLAAQGAGWDVLYTDPAGSISNPVSSRDGTRLAYTVSESSVDGHPDWHNNTADIKVLSLTGPRSAGTSTALAGASDPGFLEYYPAFSPDDAFIAFTRAPAPSNKSRCRQGVDECDNRALDLGENPDGPYYNRKGEIFVVPSTGGTPHRLRANDPVACGGEVSPGVLNSWPKWSSKVREYEGKNYYFVIFSSARAYAGQFNLEHTDYTPPIETKSSHLYMSVVEHDPATGELVSYAPIYLWNQNFLATGPDSYEELTTANLTPVWEDFSIPAVPPVIVVR